MLTQTTETAIQCLLYLARSPEGTMVTPQKISTILDTSSSYTSKILRLLSKAGLLQSHRGVQGGFTLNMDPKSITILDIYQACQDPGPNNYCDGLHSDDLCKTCGYHQAMFDIQSTFLKTLSKWTIYNIGQKPSPSLKDSPNCYSRWTHTMEKGETS